MFIQAEQFYYLCSYLFKKIFFFLLCIILLFSYNNLRIKLAI